MSALLVSIQPQCGKESNILYFPCLCGLLRFIAAGHEIVWGRASFQGERVETEFQNLLMNTAG